MPSKMTPTGLALSHGAPYVTLEHAPELIARALHPGAEPVGEATALNRTISYNEYEKRLRESVYRGELIARNPATRLPLQPPFPMPTAIVGLEELTEYLGQQGIVLDFGFVAVDELIPDLAAQLVEAQADRWRKDGANNDIRYDVAWGCAQRHLQRVITERVRAGEFVPLNGVPRHDEVLCDTQWGVCRVDAEHLQGLARENLPGELWGLINKQADEKQPREERIAREQKERNAAKNAAGRYTPWEAMRCVSEHTRESVHELLRRLDDAALKDGLSLYRPGSNLPLDYKQQAHKDGLVYVHRVLEMHWDELNAWLQAYAPRIAYRFPDASPRPVADVAKQGSVVDSHPIPPQDVVPSDPKVADLQQTYDELYAKEGKAPSQRDVWRRSGYARGTVRRRWNQINKKNRAKLDH